MFQINNNYKTTYYQDIHSEPKIINENEKWALDISRDFHRKELNKEFDWTNGESYNQFKAIKSIIL